MAQKIKNILVSQPQPVDFEKSPYGELAKKYNLVFEFNKFFRIEGICSSDFRKEKIYLLEYTAVIFSSKNAVDNYFRLAKELRLEIPDEMKYFCFNESVAYYLQKYIQFRKRKIFFGKEDIMSLLDIMKKHKTEKFLFPCADNHKDTLPALLDEAKFDYCKAVMYKTVPNDLSNIDLKQYDMLVFFSPTGIQSLRLNFPDFEQGNIIIAAMGSTTTQAVIDANLTLNISAPTKTSPSITSAIDEYLQKINKK
ncbi:MAG: uroporphyrinogen-III synthase [Lentimicrobiaceae bacterium]|jgi:uroporphyrinogen-III synthase|nr:uroporphyrinogen-III synthase [Lentimicrobiaceae bacterium]